MSIARPLFVANWKMNLCQSETKEFFASFRTQSQHFVSRPKPIGAQQPTDVVFAPSFTSLAATKAELSSLPGTALGAQNVHWLDSGAHTGEISGRMLSEIGVDYVLVGHSERRLHYGESSSCVTLRAQAALRSKITPIICVGESLLDFDEGRSEATVMEQLRESLAGIDPKSVSRLVLAYEPVWAIGTGRAATPEIAKRIHGSIRSYLESKYFTTAHQIPILYGGSTSPENIEGLLALENIDGALVGGASLKPDSFCALIDRGWKGFLSRGAQAS